MDHDGVTHFEYGMGDVLLDELKSSQEQEFTYMIMTHQQSAWPTGRVAMYSVLGIFSVPMRMTGDRFNRLIQTIGRTKLRHRMADGIVMACRVQ